MDAIRHRIVTDMCFTYRHDYGLEVPDGADLVHTCGMTRVEREALYKRMDQLYNHYISDLVEALLDTKRLSDNPIIQSRIDRVLEKRNG